MKTRRLLAADEPFLWEMLYHAIFVPPGELPPGREVLKDPEISRYAEGWGRADDLGIVALPAAHGEPIGAVWSRLLPASNHGYGYIDDETPELSIAVLPAYRGLGVGRRLMSELLRELRGRYRAVSLSVTKDNRARKLYQDLGFRNVKDQGVSVTMVRRLS